MALFNSWIEEMKKEINITGHDQKIAKKIAGIMCGGDLPTGSWVSEQHLLDLEREAFLCAERKTLRRIEAILQGKKPPRN